MSGVKIPHLFPNERWSLIHNSGARGRIRKVLRGRRSLSAPADRLRRRCANARLVGMALDDDDAALRRALFTAFEHWNWSGWPRLDELKSLENSEQVRAFREASEKFATARPKISVSSSKPLRPTTDNGPIPWPALSEDEKQWLEANRCPLCGANPLRQHRPTGVSGEGWRHRLVRFLLRLLW